MSNFITNSKEKNLGNRINTLIEGSKELKFLVGYFYFSGTKELYDSLVKKKDENFKLKILVGLNVDTINSNIIEFRENKSNNEEKRNELFDSVKKTINQDNYDTKEMNEKVLFFLDLIEKDKLIIRKTKEANHSKIYIFDLSNKILNGLFITGSSNLTSNGLVSQNEFNVEIKDYGFEEANNYFDELWETSIKITEDNTVKEKLIKIIKDETHIKEITPYEAYLLSIKSYLDTNKKEKVNDSIFDILEKNNYEKYSYQIDAIAQGLSIIKENNGLIIADVVGLGKSIIASCIAKSLNKRGIIISPPSLIGSDDSSSGWKKYREDFKLYDWEIFSLGKLEDANKFVKDRDIDIVVIDEAHRFRNNDTESYSILKEICRDKIVILLTATPFNNSPDDILSLLDLFINTKNSNLGINSDLKAEFKNYQTKYKKISFIKKNYNKKIEESKKKYKSIFEGEEEINFEKLDSELSKISKEIRNTIEPVTIRRNRLDIENNPNYSEEVKNLSKLQDPIEYFFELTEKQSNFYDEVLNSFNDDDNSFKGAIYKPFAYELGLENTEDKEFNEDNNFEYYQQINLFTFMKRLLIKRFESSFGAFRKTLENFITINKKILKFVEKTDKYFLDKKLIEKIYELDIDDIEKELSDYSEKMENKEKSSKIYKLSEMRSKDLFLEHIKNDIKLFDCFIEKMNELDLFNNDPKLKKLKEEIKTLRKDEPNRKIIIFSEYLDTVKYLEDNLKYFENELLVVKKNIDGNSAKQINENFDASTKEKDQKNKYSILLGTDRISEGLNLNRAGIIINYDIPWNPVRVIQRVGRINRISKKVFDEIYIANFFPSKTGEDAIKSRETAGNKMFMIHNILGEDSKIFSASENISPSDFFKELQKNPDKTDEESFYTKVLSIYENIKKEDPSIIEKINKLPQKVKVAKGYNKNELILIFKKLRLYVYYYDYKHNEPDIRLFEDIFDNIKCNKDTEKLELSNSFWDNYEKVKNYKENIRKYKNENDIETKALNSLRSITRLKELEKYNSFIQLLIEDIESFGTLSKKILKNISNVKRDTKSIITLIENLEIKLGINYLNKEKEKQNQKSLKKELIISIENLKVDK